MKYWTPSDYWNVTLSICEDLGLDLTLGNVLGMKDVKIVGSPPTSTSLGVRPCGRHVVVCRILSTPSEVEAALHEIAHFKLGITEEFACYELEASWALRFPVAVSTVVAEMAAEAGYM